MDLLLFLSAILTALTGAITGTRAAEPQQMSASSIVAPVAAAANQAVRAMPVAAFLPIANRPAAPKAFFVAAPAPALFPAFADRRRE
jgi:hypothetical protein